MEPPSSSRSQETSGRQSLENRPEYKRPRVSAVRDFPLGCGRFATSIGTSNDSGSCMDMTAAKNSLPRITVDCVRDFQPECGTHMRLKAKAFDQVKKSQVDVQKEEVEGSKLKLSRVTPSLKPAESPPSWWNGKVAHKSKPDGGLSVKKREKPDSKLQLERSKDALRTKVHSEIGGHSLKKSPIGGKTIGFGQASSSSLHDNNTHDIRRKVTDTLRRFKDLCIQLEYEKSKVGGTSFRRVDFQAAKMLKKERKYINTGKQILGPVPGIEVGDEFHYRIELNIIGLHHPTQGGIDYAQFDGKILATSIVASGGYADDLHNLHSLTYTGQGGNVMQPDRAPEDQKLERGNLALNNSMFEKTPVRMIRGFELSDGKTKNYIYDGLYLVVKSWREAGTHGKLVFKFQLDRIEGQRLLRKK